MKAKLINIISFLHLRISDLFLALGFIPMAIFLINGQLFMQYPNPDDVALKLWMIVPLFVFLLINWGIYIYLECKGEIAINKYIIYSFAILAIIGLIGILSQQSSFSINMIKADGEKQLIHLDISATHFIFFAFDIISILLFIFIGLFIFPKRFQNITIFRVLGYIIFAFCFLLIIYSYCTELSVYKEFIDALLNGNKWAMNWYGAKSFIIHKNAFGMVLLMGIIFCLINHSIERKWFYFPLMIFFFANMIFTFCKTSLVISPIIIFFYIIYCLFASRKANKLLEIVVILIIFIIIMVVGISYFSKGSFLKPIYNFVNAIVSSDTIGYRELIWNNTYQLIEQKPFLSMIFGRGFGILNVILFPMNQANENSPLSFPTHSGYLNLFAEGGFLYLFAYLALLGYSIYIAVKCFKKNPSTTLAISLGLFSFVFYSLIETIHYLTYVFMFVLFTYYSCLKKQQSDNK